MQRRMLEAGPLLKRDGTLVEKGYSQGLIKRLNSGFITEKPKRLRGWECYHLLSDMCRFNISVSQGRGRVYLMLSLFDMVSDKVYSCLKSENADSDKLGDELGGGMVHMMGKRYEITIRNKGESTHIYGHVYDFFEKTPMLFDFILRLNPLSSIAYCDSLQKRESLFYYTLKSCCLTTDGRVIFGDREYLFPPSAAVSCADSTRGAFQGRWTRRIIGVGGIVEGAPFGLNLVEGLSNATTENAFFYAGHMNKLENISIQVATVNGKKDLKRPLTVIDGAGRLKLLFTPKLKGEFRIGGSLKGAKESYVAGNLQGTALLDNGRLLNIANIPAFYHATDASF